MIRKTSTTPTRVFKYRCYAPIENKELAEATFADARFHYNQLITIELVRRRKYREARARLFPEYEFLQSRLQELSKSTANVRKLINEAKSATKSRKVDEALAEELSNIKQQMDGVRTQVKELKSQIVKSEELSAVSKVIDKEAADSIKALRKGRYWGTYNATEAAAKRASVDSITDPEFNSVPPHQLKSRLSVQFQGGITVVDLEADTQLQIHPMNRPEKKHPIGEKRRQKEKLLKIRVGSDDKKKPIFASFPMLMHRPLPADSKIMQAFVTRRPNTVRCPWRYEVCIVLESKTFESPPSLPSQKGVSAINFGWRLMEDGIRVAVIQNDVQGFLGEVRIPNWQLARLEKCRELQSLLDVKFTEIKQVLGGWIKNQQELEGWDKKDSCPEQFLEAFRNLAQFRSQHNLAELVWYWKSHRFPGDHVGFALASTWLERYRHLADWEQHQRAGVLRWRNTFYFEMAAKIATTARRVVIDSFAIDQVARLPRPEEEKKGGDKARGNRVIAAPGELREKIIKACAKYGCEVVMTNSKNTTRRCAQCGSLEEVEAKLDHTCKSCGASWDQDVNNTDNLADREASGKVTEVIASSKPSKKGGKTVTKVKSLRAARKEAAMMTE